MKKMTSCASAHYFLHRGLFRLKAQFGLFVFLFASLNALGQTPPSNNNCEGATAISCGQTVSGSTENAESSLLSPSCTGGSLVDVYYSFTGLPGQTYTVTVNGDDYDGVLVAYSGSCGDLEEITCADEGLSSGVEETITFTVPSIQTVYLQTYDWSSSGGSFSLTLSCTGTANPPGNNNCISYTFIPMGETVLGTTTSATPDGPEIECGFEGDGTQNDVWYGFTAPNGNLTIETTSTGVGSSDTQIQVLDVCNGDVLACDEDGGVGLASLLEFECGDLNPGQFYYIQVDAYFGLNVNFNISVTTSDPCPAPSNNLACNAIDVSCGDVISGTTIGATSNTRCGFAEGRLGVWYKLDLDFATEVSLETCFEGTTFETDLSVFTGPCTDLECFSGFSDDGYHDGEPDCEFQSFAAGGPGAVFTAPAGSYYIMVHGFTAASAGNFELSVSCEQLPPENDSACDAINVNCGDVVSGSNINAALSERCAFSGGNRPGVWYQLDVATLSEVSLETCLPGTNFDTDISVFTGACSDLTCFNGLGGDGYLDGDPDCEFTAWAAGGSGGVFTAPQGTYSILVHGFSVSDVGNFEFSISCEPIIPENDLPCNAITVTCGDVVSGNNINASLQERCGAGGGRPGVWYQLDLDSDQEVTLETCLPGTNFDTDISVFTGSCSDLTCFDGFSGDGYIDGASGCEFASWAAGGPDGVFIAPAGTYYIMVHGFGTELTGNFELSVSCESLTPPENDLCVDAIPISCGLSVSGNTVNAESTSLSPSCTGGSLNDLYYFFTALPGQTYTVTVNGDDYDGVLAAYYGSCGDLEEIACADDGISSGLEETITFTVPSIQTVYLQTYDWSSTGGSFSLTLSCSGTANPPGNNNCFNYTLIPMGETVLGTTTSATPDGPEIECGFEGDGTQNDVWYGFTAPNGNLTIETTSTGVGSSDTQIQVLDGCNGDVLACDEDGGVVLASLLEFECGDLNPGQLYYIQVDAYNGIDLNFNISVTTSDPCPAPPNDLACNAIEVSCGDVISGTSVGATAEPRCGLGGDRLGVWYVLDIENPSEVSLETCFSGTGFDTDISVFTGSCEDLTCFSGFNGNGYLDGESDCEFVSWSAGGSGGVFEAPAGTYYIMVHGFGSSLAGDFELSVLCEPLPPENDLACNAIEVACGDLVSGTTIGATPNLACNGNDRLGVWYELNIDTESEVTLETCLSGTDFDTDISVFTGTCSDLTCFDGFSSDGYIDGDPDCEVEAWAAGGIGSNFTASPGTYFILIHGFSNGLVGNFELSVSCEPLDAVSINGSVNWNSACGERDATIALFQAGTANFVANYNVTVNSSGNFSTEISETGLHDIFLKVDGYLAKVSAGVNVNPGSNTLNFGAITPGDITGNNSIGIGDFSGISTAYNTDIGDPAYNELADFNCDGTINIQDYSSFSSNYGSVGDQPGL